MDADFFNKDFNSSIASTLATNTDRAAGLQSASFLFEGNNSHDPIPSSSIPSVQHNSSLPLSDHKQQILPSISLPIIPTHRPPITQPWQHYHPSPSSDIPNGYSTQTQVTSADSSRGDLELESCDPIEQEYLLAAKLEQEAPLPDTTTDLINLEYSFKKEELAERVAGIRLGGHTSSSNTPNSSSSSSGVKTPSLLPVSIPRLSPSPESVPPPTHRYMELSHSHETVCEAPAYNGPIDPQTAGDPVQKLDHSGGQDLPTNRPPLPNQHHTRAHSDQNSNNSSTQLHSLLSEQKLTAPTDRFPGSHNSAFSRHPLFPPLPPPTSHPPLLLPPTDQHELEVQQASLKRRSSRSEMSVGTSDPEEALPRSNSALDIKFTPAPPPSKPLKKTKRPSKPRVPRVRDPFYDTSSDQDRPSSGGGGVPRAASYSNLNRSGSKSRNSKPFPMLPKPPQITTEVPLPDPPKRSPPLLTDPLYQRELPSLPEQTAPRYLPQPPRPYPDPNLSLPVGSDYPYPPYGYPHMARWPAPPDEEGAPGYPHQHFYPHYYPYPYMMYPPGTEDQQPPPGYPPYPYPYYHMMPPMYPYMSHPGSRAGSYAPSMVDEEMTERESVYSEDPGNVTLAQWQQQYQQQFMERDPSYQLEQVSSQPVSFEVINPSSTPVPEVEPKRCTPLLFDYPHTKGSFGGGGALLLTPYAHSTSGVRICSLERLCRLPLLDRHASFPGPLNSLSVKSEVVRFAQERVTAAQREGDTDGALLWEYLSRLCAQNGVLVPSDVVELLSRGGGFSVRGGESGVESRQAGDQLRLLVLQRRIKEAVELCITQGMWTHALLLAHTLDEHTRASVQDRFTYSLHASDPLQCYYSAVVGKRPHGVHVAYLREGHSWKQHLAMLISHRHLSASENSISTLADNLAECGHTDAAHLVRLIQGQPLGGWGDAEARYSLLGVEGSGIGLSSRNIRPEELHKTEMYEYARSLSNSEFSLPGFQPFKFRLAGLYAEAGLLEKAFSYCEAISVSVEKQPCSYSMPFLSQLRTLSDLLHGSMLPLASTPIHQPPIYPRWISLLSSYLEQQRGGAIYVPTPFLPLLTPTPSLMSPYPHTTAQAQHTDSTHVVNNTSAYVHPQPASIPTSQPISFAGRPSYPGPVVGSPDDDDATTESYKSAADESILGVDGHNTDEEVLDFDIPSIGSSPLPPGMISGPQSPSESINRSAGSSGKEETGGLIGFMGNFVGRIRSKSNANKNQMRLPKSDRFFFDADKNVWIDKEGGEEEAASAIPPPKDTDLIPPSGSGAPVPFNQPQPLESQGILSHNPRSRYVDVLNRTTAAPVVPLFPTSFDTPFNGTLFIPKDLSGQLPESDHQGKTVGGRGSPDAVSVTTASISEASKEVRHIMRNTQHLSNPHPAGMRY